jgi:hypothetical protein
VLRASSLAFALAVIARVATGQQPAGAPPTVTPAAPTVGAPLVAPDSSPPIERPNSALVRAATYTYQLSLTRPGSAPTPLGVRTVQVTDAPMAGVPSWLIAESRTGSAVTTTDSLWVTRTDLSPERWMATIDRTQLAASFTPDSVYAAMQSYRGRSSFSAALPPGALLTPGMVDRVVELLPLRSGYRASAWLLLMEQGAARALPAELAVEREDRTRIGASDVNCWVVVLRAGVMEERLWVSKDAPRVVRTEQTVGGGVVVGVIVI